MSVVQTPDPFDWGGGLFDVWIMRLERYFNAAGIDGDEKKVHYLVYLCGEKGEELFQTFSLTDEQRKVYDRVKQEFRKFFKPKEHKIMNRGFFNQRVQGPDEDIESFIADCYRLHPACQYPAGIAEELLRDRIAVGVNSPALREKLTTNENLKLNSCVAIIRQWYSSQKLSNELQSRLSGTTATAAAVRGKRHQNPPKSSKHDKNKRESTQSNSRCYRCGKEKHRKSDCPAIKATCNRCKKKGHYAEMCKSKAINAIDDDDTEAFMGKVTADNETIKDEDFTIKLFMDHHPVTFQIDCGADLTVIGKNHLPKNTQLRPSDRILIGASMNRLKVLGCFNATLKTTKGKVCLERCYVVNHIRHPLLGKPAIKALNLLKRINTTTDATSDAAHAREQVFKDFPALFSGLGTMKGVEYDIKLKENSTPHAISAPRRVAQPLLPQVKQELERMERIGVVRKLDDNEVSEHVAPMVVVPKPGGKVRICVDLKKLNENVVRPRHVLPSVDETLAKLKKGQFFSKLDANSGFWQIKLSERSQLLTTFLTPFGRYCHLKLPFGITSGPEFYQREVDDKIVQNADNIACLIDDIAVASGSVEQHKRELYPVLEKLQNAGLTLNREKCEFFVDEITFVGHKINRHGICQDDRKIAAVQHMPQPQNITDLRSFLGLCQQLAKFSHKLASLIEPLRALLSDKNEFLWSQNHTQAFEAIKSELTSPRVLMPYHPEKATKVMTDASRSGFGAILLQKECDATPFRPVYFASKSLSKAEKNYSVIELEAASIVYACQKFDKYLLGMPTFEVETDHKPLISLLGSKDIDKLPPRIVRFRLALMRYNFTIKHVNGKDNVIADCLSRASIPDEECNVFEKQCTSYINGLLGNLPATDRRLESIKENQHEDEICLKIAEYARTGWPNAKDIPPALKQYATFKDEFSVCEGLLLKAERIVIPASLRLEMLATLHQGHLGIDKTRKRALDSMWWPGLNTQIEQQIKNCQVCARSQREIAEPLIPTPLPSRPWEKIAMDICDISGNKYLVIWDYYSKWLEFSKLQNMTMSCIIMHLKSVFARYGIPVTIVADNQFATANIESLATDYGFTLVTSSPRMPSANGAAERAVQTFKNLFKKNKDPYLALLAYRSTPLLDGLSPAERLMGRKLRSNVPQCPRKLVSQTPDDVKQNTSDIEFRTKMLQKNAFDKRHATQELPPLDPGEPVVIRDRNEQGTVVMPAANSPRSYVVRTPDNNNIRRNRRMLQALPQRQSTRNAQPTKFYGSPLPWKSFK